MDRFKGFVEKAKGMLRSYILNQIGSETARKGVESAKSKVSAFAEDATARVFEVQGKWHGCCGCDQVAGCKYRARKLLGEGGFGYVWLVADERGTLWALK